MWAHWASVGKKVHAFAIVLWSRKKLAFRHRMSHTRVGPLWSTSRLCGRRECLRSKVACVVPGRQLLCQAVAGIGDCPDFVFSATTETQIRMASGTFVSILSPTRVRYQNHVWLCLLVRLCLTSDHKHRSASSRNILAPGGNEVHGAPRETTSDAVVLLRT